MQRDSSYVLSVVRSCLEGNRHNGWGHGVFFNGPGISKPYWYGLHKNIRRNVLDIWLFKVSVFKRDPSFVSAVS